MASVGNHLVGLPDILVTFIRKDDRQPSTNDEQLAIAALIDEIGDQMAREGVDAAVAARHATLSDDTRYDEDEYKFNPFGVVTIRDKKL